jgi:hypothetical protein
MQCVKDHKELYGCTGISKPLKFIPLKEFTDSNLRKDMNFLMDIIRVSGQSYKLVTKLSRADNRKRFNFLVSECRNRGIEIKIMPKAMTRHLRNTSLYDKNEKIIVWHLEWRIRVKDSEIECETSGNIEDWCIKDLLSRALESFKKIPAFVLNFPGQNLENFKVLWLVGKEKSENEPKEVFKEINTTKSLREILPGLSNITPITEFPCFYIIKDILPNIQIINNYNDD